MNRAPTGCFMIALLLVTTVADASPPVAEDSAAGARAVGRLDSLLTAGAAAQAALEAAVLLARTGPDSPYRGAFLQRQCLAWQKSGNFSRALSPCEEAVRSDPNDPVNHLSLARCLGRLEQPGRAIAEYQQALELAADHVDWRVEYAQALRDLGIAGEAQRQFDLAAAQCPDCPEVDRMAADAALREGRPEQAIGPLRRMLARKPSLPLRLTLAQACWASRRLADLDSLLAGVPLEALQAGELRLLLQADRESGRHERGVRLAPGGPDESRAPAGLRQDATYWALIAELCGKGEDFAAGLAAYERASAIAPEDPRWHHNRAAMLAKLGRDGEAARELERARALGDGGS
jgi:tetratricopeptide (TPR) repeat protein